MSTAYASIISSRAYEIACAIVDIYIAGHSALFLLIIWALCIAKLLLAIGHWKMHGRQASSNSPALCTMAKTDALGKGITLD